MSRQITALYDTRADAEAAKSRLTAANIDAKLREFHVGAVTGGMDALGETSVVLELDGQTASGQGVATDILEAAAIAYVRALSNVVRKAANAAESDAPELQPAGTP